MARLIRDSCRVLLFVLVCIPYGSHAEATDIQFCSSEGQVKVEEKLADMGYRILKMQIEEPTPWEKDIFDTKRKRTLKVKSKRPVPGEQTLYYRFVLIEEVYATDHEAALRFANLDQKPPGLRPEEDKAFPLYKGWVQAHCVFLLKTDVYRFVNQLERLENRLHQGLQ